jgi:glycosyltransferase involved in cell wall biosynthesis
MPVYNGEKYILQAIESVLNQSYQHFEFIIIDDGSTDRSAAIVKGFSDTRIRYEKNEKNLGLIASLNKAVMLCNGAYLARIDSDDVCVTRRLEKQLSVFLGDSKIGVVGSMAEIIDAEGRSKGLFKVPQDNFEIKCGMLFNNQIIHPGVMIKRTVLDQFGPQFFDSRDLHVEDYGLWVKMLHHTDFFNIQEPLLKYRIHDSNISTLYSDEQERNSLAIRGEVAKLLDVKPNLVLIVEIMRRSLDKELEVDLLNKEVFDPLAFNLKHSEFISRVYWECMIKLKLNNKSCFRKYLKSSFKKRVSWIVLLFLCPAIKRLPQSLFSRRFRIFATISTK